MRLGLSVCSAFRHWSASLALPDCAPTTPSADFRLPVGWPCGPPSPRGASGGSPGVFPAASARDRRIYVMRLDNKRTSGCVAPSSRASRLISDSLYDRPALSPPAFSPRPSRDYSCLRLPFGVACLGSDWPFETRQFSVTLDAVSETWDARGASPTSGRAYPAHNQATHRTPIRLRLWGPMVADVGAKERQMIITDRIEAFREAARHIWNVHFRQEAVSRQDWDLRDAFSDVYIALFRAMVCYPLPGHAPCLPHLYTPELTVLTPYRVAGENQLLSLMINRTKPASGYWDHPIKHVESKAVDLRLISFFDWENLGFRELRYFRVRIVNANDPDLIDRDALAEVSDCRVEYEEPQPTAAASPSVDR